MGEVADVAQGCEADGSDQILAQRGGGFRRAPHGQRDLNVIVVVAGDPVVLAGLGAVLMSMVSLRRVDSIGRASEEIVAGNLQRRLPVRGTGDEFDRLAVQVNTMLDRIQSLMHGLQQVSNDIAHDLKTPLTRLRHGLELVRGRTVGLADYQAAVDQAIAECDVTLRTFDALLRIAQIEAGTRRAAFQCFDLSRVAETIAEAYQPVAEDQNHVLSARVDSGAIVLGDHDLVTQMLANLVENALKHTPPGTRIAIELSCRDGRSTLQVEDDGPGIPETERDRVFQRFYRLDASRNTAGSGLGLSLVAAVAHLHDSAVTLADAGPGLRATITFPRMGPEHQATRSVNAE